MSLNVSKDQWMDGTLVCVPGSVHALKARTKARPTRGETDPGVGYAVGAAAAAAP